jgi:3-hydroxyacyl-CoA dehydrogenase/3a,7a,12a-trihydroxy-5b-cholest-24-enoyl-CoA hydratase
MTDAADLLRFDGQVALITGSGRGLGREYALMLASRGCKIMVNDVNHADADTTVADITALGGGAAASYASVENGEAIVSETQAAFGRLDILVNNAGILTPETWRFQRDEGGVARAREGQVRAGDPSR